MSRCPSTVQDGGAETTGEGVCQQRPCRVCRIQETLKCFGQFAGTGVNLPPSPAPPQVRSPFDLRRPWVFFSLPGAHSRPGWEMGTSLLGELIFIFPLPEVDFCAFGFQGQGCVVPPPRPPGREEEVALRTPLKPQFSLLTFPTRFLLLTTLPALLDPHFPQSGEILLSRGPRPEPTLVEIGDILQGPGLDPSGGGSRGATQALRHWGLPHSR